jgi:hypothetical protein
MAAAVRRFAMTTVPLEPPNPCAAAARVVAIRMSAASRADRIPRSWSARIFAVQSGRQTVDVGPDVLS